MEAIVAFFASIGYPLEHFPETDDMGELWQYDGYDDGNEKCIQLTLGKNRMGKPSVSGSVDLTYDQGYDVSCSLDSWLETFKESVTKLLVYGDASGW